MQAQVAISADFLEAYAGIPRKSQKRVRAFIEKFKADPTQPGIHYEPIHDTVDEAVRTVRIGDDYRAIVIRPDQGNVFLLVWVAHHDEAMAWASRKRFAVHPHTGTLQVWEPVAGAPANDTAPAPAPMSVVKTDPSAAVPSGRLLAGRTDDELLLLGVPEPLLPAVRALRTDEDLDELARFLPAEASDALYLLAAGFTLDEAIEQLAGKAPPAAPEAAPSVDTTDFSAALARPGTQRSFKLVEDDDELAEILNAPLAQWRIFLHPAQRRLVTARSNGPMRVLGGAGTGKTVVAMHRARHLAKEVFPRPDQRILFTTFTKNLASDLRRQLGDLCGPELARIEVVNLDDWASHFLKARGISVKPWPKKSDDRQQLWLRCIGEQAPTSDLPWSFYADEWELVASAQGVTDEAAYLKARRAGRGTPLTRGQRKGVWRVLGAYRAELERAGLLDYGDVLDEARRSLERLREQAGPGAASVLPYAAVVADEVQDFSPQALRLLRALVPEGPNDLFVVGDAHQRIYRHQSSLGTCGINIRGRRSRRLTVNYRTTARIRRFAEALLEGMPVDDLDDGLDSLRGYRSLRLGVAPEIAHCPTADAEAALILARVREWLADHDPETLCIAARKRRYLTDRYQPLLEGAGIATTIIEKQENTTAPGVRLATLHRVKGLEFPLMILASIHEGDMPLALPPDALCDDAARKAHEDGERRLLYVAATRARDALVITGYGRRCAWLGSRKG